MFLVLAHRNLKPAGCLALVMPLSLMSGDAWEASRELLLWSFTRGAGFRQIGSAFQRTSLVQKMIGSLAEWRASTTLANYPVPASHRSFAATPCSLLFTFQSGAFDVDTP